MIAATITLSILLLVGIYIGWNLLRKVERLEDAADNYAGYIIEISNVIQQTGERLTELDKKGMFEADDEIGFFFTEIKNIQDILNSINVNEPTSQEEERS